MNKFMIVLLMLFGSLASAQTIEELYADRATVIAPSIFSFTWAIPDTRENGDSLSVNEIRGYELYITAALADGEPLADVINIAGGTTTTYDFPIPGPGVYKFAMAAIDTDGLSSELTAIMDQEVADKSRPSRMPELSVTIVCEDGATCNFIFKQ